MQKEGACCLDGASDERTIQFRDVALRCAAERLCALLAGGRGRQGTTASTTTATSTRSTGTTQTGTQSTHIHATRDSHSTTAAASRTTTGHRSRQNVVCSTCARTSASHLCTTSSGLLLLFGQFSPTNQIRLGIHEGGHKLGHTAKEVHGGSARNLTVELESFLESGLHSSQFLLTLFEFGARVGNKVGHRCLKFARLEVRILQLLFHESEIGLQFSQRCLGL
mmetsp:Transcript_29058/g.73025  ORF Transcript_29058/g.73025 Transcript_29058/m.73025 type:complete len:223 (-) Transcript_29058:2997-3665(-)